MPWEPLSRLFLDFGLKGPNDPVDGQRYMANLTHCVVIGTAATVTSAALSKTYGPGLRQWMT